MDKFRGLAAVALLRILSWLSFSAVQRLASLQGRLLYALKSRNRRAIEANLLHCFPHWPAQQRDAFTRRCLVESAKTALEMGPIWHWPCDRTNALIREVQGQQLLDVAIAKKRGVIVLAPHLGNWEMVGYFLAQVGRVTSLYAPAKIPALDHLIYAGRTRNGSRLVPTNTGGVKSLLKALKAGEIVGILPDQVPEEGNGIYAPFFGHAALTMTLLTALVQRTGAEVLCCYAKRRRDGQGFDICLQAAAEGIKAKDELMAVTAMNISVERCINDCSEQYQWGYKRFREREGNSISLYLQDRRLQVRRVLREPFMVRCSQDAGWSATLLNLTPGGLMFSTKHSLSVGARYNVCLASPAAEVDENIAMEVKCLWSKPGTNPGEYYSGALVTFMAHRDARQLLSLLERFERKPWQSGARLFLLECLACLPLPVLTMAGHVSGSVERRLRTRQQVYTDLNIRSAFPGQDKHQHQQRVRDSLQHYGRILLGRPFVRLASSRRVASGFPLRWRATESLALFHSVLAQRRGVVLLVSNAGYWEILLREIARQFPLTLLYRPALTDIGDRSLYRAAQRDGYAVMSLQENFADTVLRITQQGGVAALLPDQVLLGDKPLLAPFFGHSIQTMDLFPLATAAVDIFHAYVVRQTREPGYEIILEQASALATATDANACAVALNQCLEQGIQQYPEQYHWHGRLFRK